MITAHLAVLPCMEFNYRWIETEPTRAVFDVVPRDGTESISSQATQFRRSGR